MLNKRVLIPLVLLTTAIFAIGYGIINNNIPLFKSLETMNNADSIETDFPPEDFTYNKDVSQMFNERGFYKSNSVSFDENEIINDYNGSLMYEIPLYSFKQAGEMKFDVKLVYNSSVGHKVFVCDSARYWSLNTVYSYNMNSPEWILSVNGIAVQVFNFEPNFFTKNISSNEIKDNDVNMLIPGYHFDDNLRNLASGDRDRINIMLGDGSSINLVNLTNANSYVGDYYSEGKESYYKAKVYYVETTGDNSYRNRMVELSMGDGLVYFFREYKREFNDLKFGTGLTYMRPQMLLLEAIKDKLGNMISLGYEFSSAPSTFNAVLYGRPLFVGASSNGAGNCTFNMLYSGSLIKVNHNSTVNGSYFLTIDPPAYFVNSSNNGAANNIASFTKIRNPLFQTSTFQYFETPNYKRTLADVPNPFGNSSLDIVFTNLRRIKNNTNYLGGYREYTYYGDNNMTMTYTANQYNKTSQYAGYGREPFYTNMLSRKKTKDENSNWKNQLDFTYYYEDKGNTDAEYPVDASDSLYTKTETTSLHSSTNNNSATDLRSLKYYRIYPVKYPNQIPFPPETSVYEFNGSTKLIQDESIDVTNSNLYIKNKYTYELGSQSNGTFLGSMLMNSKKNIVEGIERLWNYSYTYDGSSDQYDRPIIGKSETDPKGNQVITSILNLDTAFAFNIFTAGYSGQKDTVDRNYYKLGLPYDITSKNSSNAVTSKKTNGYLRTLNDSKGYYGQLISEKIYGAPNFTTAIETNYEYYKQDTIGQAFYSGGTIPYKEGSLKVVKRPDNEETVYFYHPISAFEDETYNPNISAPIRPSISYRTKYSNGNTTITKHFWADNRLPIRIDSYKRTGSSSVDTLKREYFEYNEAGLPIKIINYNRYLTEFVYQPTHRIRSITLPGDFSTSQNDTTFMVDTNFFYDTVNVSSPGWGNRNELSSNTLNYENAPQILRVCQNFYMQYKVVSEQYTQKRGLFMKFENIPNFAEIVNANLRFAIKGFTRTLNGSPMSDNQYVITLKPVIDLGNDTNIQGCTGNLSIFQSNNINISSLSQEISINSSGNTIYKFQNVDVADLLNSLMGTQNKTLSGFYISGGLPGIVPDPLPNFELLLDANIHQGTSPSDWSNWRDSCIPSLSIYGKIDASDTIKIVNVAGGTYVYEYDDENKNVTIHSRLTHTPNKFKKTKYRFDGFGNIKEKDVYTSSSAFDDYNFAFNFMNQPAENIDARNNSSKLSYDYLGRQKKTLNADNSFSTVAYAYDDDLGSYFGTTYSGFVEKRTFTDETNREFNKYFDAVGNLLREEKFVAANGGGEPVYEDNPYDPDTTFSGQDFPSNMAALTTDYRYDALYRLVEVKTPAGRSINYYYDAYGRQSRRITPDAGITMYSFDNNGNLILSQDANQRTKNSSLNTRRTYDGLNRLLTISDFKLSGTPTETGPMGDTLLPFEFDSPPGTDSIYVVNVYDTITTATVAVFNNIPSDYNSSPNYTKGNLVATAYRTVLAENWGYKYYRYDERGNVTKMWHYIVGLGWKSEMYYHNSQSQLTRNWYQPNQGDGKLFTYGFDDAGRLDYVNQYMGSQPGDPENEGDYPSSYFTLTKYTYDENSQVDLHKLNDNTLTTNYNYNNRNWIFTTSQTGVSSAIFRYTMLYNANGNIRKQISLGTYRNNFSDNSDLWETYIYDNSNRLLKADRDSGVAGSTHDIINGYDKDGNFVGMKRYGSSNNLADNFSYSYYSGTNKLQRVTGTKTQYTYDDNGNMTKDDINRTSSIKYDHKNLMTEIRVIKTETPSIFEPPVDVLYLTQYKYDEAGNRVRKTRYKYTGSTPDPVFDLTGDAPPWTLQSDEFYVRDVSGKEIAIYSGSSLTQWNIWGLDNIGKINADTTRNYYLKDHLGSIRVVLNSSNAVVSAQDYDAWGYPLENRTYNSSAMKYDFTGKERDNETSYGYFGARYYDSRIGRWGQVEPLLDKYVKISPYCYSIDNPINSYDPNGKDPRRDELGSINQVETMLNDLMNSSEGATFGDVESRFESGNYPDDAHYIATEKAGFIDLKHLFTAANLTEQYSFIAKGVLALGELKEISQFLDPNSDSDFDPEDPRSNLEGVKLGVELSSNKITKETIQQVVEFINGLGAIDPSDARLSKDNVLIQENSSDKYRAPNRSILDLNYYRPFYGHVPSSPDTEKTGF